MMWFKACPRCYGDLFLDSDYYGYYVYCVQCGHSLDKPLKGRLLRHALTHQSTTEEPSLNEVPAA